jgi:thiamine biosynthesis lipoprotein
VDAGGDLVAGHPPAGLPGWPVAVAAPAAGTEAAGDLFHLWLANSSLATSGTDYRRWEVAGQAAHHIIDPHNGRPAGSDVKTATVLARSAETAEGWATAAIVAGVDRALAALSRQGLAAAMVDRQGQFYITKQMQRHLVWPPPERRTGRSLALGEA